MIGEWKSARMEASDFRGPPVEDRSETHRAGRARPTRRDARAQGEIAEVRRSIDQMAENRFRTFDL
jgi:hypothetical protein